MRRRALLAGITGATGLAGATSLAGCLSTGGSGGGSLDEHPASRSLDGQPSLGEPPAEATKLIVAFEDPTCSTCQRFHSSGFQDVKREIVEPDSAAFVYRPYRYTGHAWATPAINAILDTTARDRGAAWDLIDFYYANTYSISGGTWADSTRSFLAENTGVDAEAVVEAGRNRTHQSILETAESDGDEAGVSSTPTFYLFEDGGFVESITGAVDVSAFQAAFQL